MIRYAALKRAWKEARLASEREHVTLYIKNHPEIFRIQTFDFPLKGTGHYRWTLDEERDYALISAVYRHFIRSGREDFVTEDVIGFLEAHPEIAALNADIGRNGGLADSLVNDRLMKESEME